MSPAYKSVQGLEDAKVITSVCVCVCVYSGFKGAGVRE